MTESTCQIQKTDDLESNDTTIAEYDEHNKYIDDFLDLRKEEKWSLRAKIDS